jgi:hypothetical protein
MSFRGAAKPIRSDAHSLFLDWWLKKAARERGSDAGNGPIGDAPVDSANASRSATPKASPCSSYAASRGERGSDDCSSAGE